MCECRTFQRILTSKKKNRLALNMHSKSNSGIHTYLIKWNKILLFMTK